MIQLSRPVTNRFEHSYYTQAIFHKWSNVSLHYYTNITLALNKTSRTNRTEHTHSVSVVPLQHELTHSPTYLHARCESVQLSVQNG